MSRVAFLRRVAHATALAVLVVVGTVPSSVASAQTRAAITRDNDNPDLAPAFFSATSFPGGALFYSTQIATVPAGKRLVVDYVSWLSIGPSSDQISDLSLTAQSYGSPRLVFPYSAPHANPNDGDPGSTSRQDGSFAGRAYFEAGESIYVNHQHVQRSPGIRLLVFVTGHYVTP